MDALAAVDRAPEARAIADRLRRDPTAVLRPLGDADVLTLLASQEFRGALVDGQGMRSAAIPSRNRGWLDLGRLDPERRAEFQDRLIRAINAGHIAVVSNGAPWW